MQRGKEIGISVDADVVKRLDEIRIQNNIATMEELEEQVDQERHLDFEDFKNNIRNQLLQQEVIRHEVGSKIILWITQRCRSITRIIRTSSCVPSR